ncbi:glycoside hydrolase family 13 protein [Tunturiibacter gelidoferens]|uniref:Alpha-glucosidase n=1 Tax=Tunturiibacter lichenicola TaxID=2051959 RepID=A0A7Y9NK07_9BACT|nr:alpha-glucosidase [Edaphobacter lichenicola]NYF50769.1 alpha-glucosidase [Edaphobacter lichenicola]
MTTKLRHRNASSSSWLPLLAILATSALWTSGSIALGQTPQPSTATAAAHNDGPWWKHAVLYEIYPRSFQDSNGDGIGDLNGITQRLDYLKSLGIDAIWIAPMYPSPQVDFGYDISDYQAVDPQYGTLADMDHLIAEGKQRNIRVVLDMVLNHTSDKHQWFIDSASSRTNPKHDWYVWNDGVPANGPNVTAYQKRFEHEGRVPPNNWISGFGGSAWEWVPAVHQFYYHKFYKQQPDLNWRNPAVEKACFDAMRFWLDRGVAGFRLDAIPTLFEDPQLRNEPEAGGINAQGDPNLKDIYTSNLSEVHGVIRRMRAMVEKYPGNRVLIGETYLPDTAALNEWYGGAKHDELQLPMDMLLGFHGDHDKLDATRFRKLINEAETQLNGSQPLFVFDNHDNVRSWNRYSDGTHDQAIARLLAAVLLTSRDTALMYYGEELGMVTSTPTRKEDVKDPIGVTGWPKEKGRDGERTPMQWDDSKNAGFSESSTTWLPVPSNYSTINVKAEELEPDSLLNWHKQLISMRRDNPTLRDGKQVMLDESNPSVLSYVREGVAGHPAIIVALNFTDQPQTISLDPSKAKVSGNTVNTLLTNAPGLKQTTSLQNITLPPYASWIGQIGSNK